MLYTGQGDDESSPCPYFCALLQILYLSLTVFSALSHSQPF
ncbi:hypothetical protein CLOM621_07937 [Clostridium sp. M62/1]|nr:hypothetical protein CLOM621_07937 [Clostridium sp. M62/1]